eukprot:5121140-Amphidinium_carterae.1
MLCSVNVIAGTSEALRCTREMLLLAIKFKRSTFSPATGHRLKIRVALSEPPLRKNEGLNRCACQDFSFPVLRAARLRLDAWD